jgi:cell wall-associated NlpC family hydrolase
MRKLDDYLMIRHTPNGRQFPFLDCWGLVCDVYREYLDIELSEYTSLSHKTMSQGFSQERESGNFQEVTTPENFDVVAFFIHGRLYHVGIFLDGRILHTSEKKNCRYEALDRVSLSDRRYYRYVGSKGCQQN